MKCIYEDPLIEVVKQTVCGIRFFIIYVCCCDGPTSLHFHSLLSTFSASRETEKQWKRMCPLVSDGDVVSSTLTTVMY